MLKKRFSQPDDVKICHFQQRLCTITQGTRSIDEYFNELNTIWEELKIFHPLPHYTCGNCNEVCFETFAVAQEKDYLFKFLNGLSKSYSSVRTKIISMRHVPSLDDALNVVLQEKSQRMLTTNTSDPISDITVMALLRSYRRSFNPEKKPGDVTCQYCRKPDHSKDSCYRLVGFSFDHPLHNSKFSRANKVGSDFDVDNGSGVMPAKEQLRKTPLNNSLGASYAKLAQEIQRLQLQLQKLSAADSAHTSVSAMAQVQCSNCFYSRYRFFLQVHKYSLCSFRFI